MKAIHLKALPLSLALAFVGAGCASHNEALIPWKEVPVAVQNTITANANGHKVDKVEKESKNGTWNYEAKVKNKDGSRIIIETSEDGKLLSVKHKSAEVETPWAKVPAPVQKTIADNANGQKINKVEKETDDGKVIYEAKAMNQDGSILIIKVGQDGKLIRVKTKKE